MNSKYEKAIKILKQNNQEEIIEILNKIEDKQKDILINQILDINFEELNELYSNTKAEPEILKNKIEHIEYTDKYKLTEEVKEKYKILGEEVIKNNQYAVVTMAGGQGTRLGHKGPKGTFKLDVMPEPKYIFQILAEKLMYINIKYNVKLPWYIMTSTENNNETTKFFEDNNFFGYDKQYIKFFMQGNLPLIFTDGKLVINKDYTIKVAADGNGCIYRAMKQSGILKDMENRGIKWIFIGTVDNILVNMVDTTFIGFTISNNHLIGAKSITKREPSERVGVFCKKNGVPSVIEYSELPIKMSELRDEEGELLYGEANIVCNLFNIEALKRVAEKKLNYHVAFKKSDYLNKQGEFIQAIEPNVYKFETFMFDVFSFFDNISILRGKREEEFAPVKNKEGKDSPQTAIKLYNEYYENMEVFI